VEYKFDKKVSENANGGYLMGMEIVPDKMKMKKKKMKKITKKIKILRNEKRETLAQKSVKKST